MAASFKPAFKCDPTKFQNASRRLAGLARKQTPQEVLTKHMRQFVGNVIALTPPSMGKADNESKKRGEEAITVDLLRLAQPVAGITRPQARGIYPTADELLALHKNSRDSRGHARRQGKLLYMRQEDFNKALKLLFAFVGSLAAGWNAAAAALGFRPPAWISRHGDRYGQIVITASEDKVRFTLINDVPFADGVEGLNRRVQSALDHTAADLERGYAAALARAAKSAGFK